MKTITLGDIHGLPVWKKVDPALYDKVIFVGDYLDGETIDPDSGLENLRQIIGFKQRYPEQVELLIGNHDLHYLYWPKVRPCSRFQPTIQKEATKIFQANADLFHSSFSHNNYLWVHAGVSNGWLKSVGFDEQIANHSIDQLGSWFNEMDKDFDKYGSTLHGVGKSRGGRANWGGITWADQSETYNDYPDNLHQIVGHSRVKKITTFANQRKNSSITYVDCFDTQVEFLKLAIE
jgi:hypothetical protein